MNENKNETDEEATKLADRLTERMKKKGPISKNPTRLGNRLSKYQTEQREIKREEISQKRYGTNEADEFFDEFVQITRDHPELEDVKISELKEVISRIGMKYPEEVAEMLKNKNFKSEVKKFKKKYITH